MKADLSSNVNRLCVKSKMLLTSTLQDNYLRVLRLLYFVWKVGKLAVVEISFRSATLSSLLVYVNRTKAKVTTPCINQTGQAREKRACANLRLVLILLLIG